MTVRTNSGGTNPAHTAHVLPAGHAQGVLHSDVAHRAITAELIACTLGARHRLELRTDTSGRLQAAGVRLSETARRLRGALRV